MWPRNCLRAGPFTREALDPYSWPHLALQLQVKCSRRTPKEVPGETAQHPQLLGIERRRSTDKELQRRSSRAELYERRSERGSRKTQDSAQEPRDTSASSPSSPTPSSRVCPVPGNDTIGTIINAINLPASTLPLGTENREVSAQYLGRKLLAGMEF